MTTAMPNVPNPETPVLERGANGQTFANRLAREWRKFFSDLTSFLGKKLPLRGAATFAAGTTAAVVFDTPEPSANYQIYASPPDSKTYWATSKTVNGFTLNASANVTGTVGWQLLRD